MKPLQTIAAASLVVALGALSACAGPEFRSEEARRLPAATEDRSVFMADVRTELEEFQNLAEESLAWRSRALEFHASVQERLKSGTHLNPEEVEKIARQAQEYVELRDRMLKVFGAESWMVSPEVKLSYAPGQGTSFTTIRRYPFRKWFKGVDAPAVVLDPLDEAGRNKIMELKIALGAALLLYDSYFIGIFPYYENPHIRYVLNREHQATLGALKKITEGYTDRKQRREIARGIVLVHKDFQWRANGMIAPEARSQEYVELVIGQSPTFRHVLESGVFAGPDSVDLLEKSVEDNLTSTKNLMTYYASKVFGNIVGLIEFRKGKLSKLPESERVAIQGALKPLDILLEKTPFRLTDKFIPGHWGHVAIWVGGEQELRALDIWDHPAVQPFQASIRSGRWIVEALRPGVQMHNLQHFLNIDDLLVLRHEGLTLAERKEYLVRVFQQIGKPYDFNFDVESDTKLVCSELAYVVFRNIDWPTRKTFGRYTISPDNIAVKATSGGVLTPIMIYYDGKRLPDNLDGGLPRLLSMLLDQKYSSLRRFVGYHSRKRMEKTVQLAVPDGGASQIGADGLESSAPDGEYPDDGAQSDAFYRDLIS